MHIPELPERERTFSEDNWQQSQHYLYAIDLFNNGYYWEVHEVLEKLWLGLEKGAPERMFLQGIIQLSVALLKKKALNEKGFKRLVKKAQPKLQMMSSVYSGVNIPKLLAEFGALPRNSIMELPQICLQIDGS